MTKKEREKENPWSFLRRFTQARIGLKRSGHSVSTRASLEFQTAHAEARDAVHLKWDIKKFKKQLGSIPSLLLTTPVADRTEYLKRPDLGRLLISEDLLRLRKLKKNFDVAIIISNGLSSAAVEKHGHGLLKELLPILSKEKFKIAPVFLVENARVGISDLIGEICQAKITLIIIGERPGLTAADSLAIYLTYESSTGKSDADRNCLSNIRPPQGLGYQLSAAKCVYLMKESLRLQISGVALKDNFLEQNLDNKTYGKLTPRP